MLQKTLFFIALCFIISCADSTPPPRWMDLHDAMEEVKDNIKPIKKAAKAKWPSYPVAEAQNLVSIFKDIEQIEEVKEQEEQFKNLLKDSQKLTTAFATIISSKTKDNTAITKAFKSMGRSCKTCHDKYKED